MPSTVEEIRFEVMSTRAHVIVVGGPPGSAEWARDRAQELERRWTRFASSELTALNARPGEPVEVSEDTRRLVEASVAAWEATGHRFDPTVLRSLEALGYDRSIEQVRARDGAGDRAGDRAADSGAPAGPSGPPESPDPPGPAPGLGSVFVWTGPDRVMLPEGVAIDPGGIGKGLAADLVVDGLLARGAAGALVNLGGDTRVAGRPPGGAELWTVSVEHPVEPGRELARLSVAGGGVATSSRLRRRWRRGATEVHHLLDPRTGEPAHTDVVAATVVAGTGWWAEASTKSLVVAGSEEGLAALVEASAIVVLEDGSVRSTPDLAGAVIG
jgi:FAD:protein FMN transferase